MGPWIDTGIDDIHEQTNNAETNTPVRWRLARTRDDRLLRTWAALSRRPPQASLRAPTVNPSLQYRQLTPAAYQTRVSRSRSELPSRPTQALRNASSALRCRLSELTTSVPGLTSGALSMYESRERTG